jgi:hypothetical protein
MGMKLVEKLSLSGMAGTWMVALSPTSIPVDPPREAGTRQPRREAHVKAQ